MLFCIILEMDTDTQGNHLSGKPVNVGEFDSCQGNVRDFTKSQESVREKILSGKISLKLFIVSCIFASILDFTELVRFMLFLGHCCIFACTTENKTSTSLI